MATPEKLNLWDRIFNRYKRTIHKRGAENWKITLTNGIEQIYIRNFVEYFVVDRVTGSESIERKYLNDAEYNTY